MIFADTKDKHFPNGKIHFFEILIFKSADKRNITNKKVLPEVSDSQLCQII